MVCSSYAIHHFSYFVIMLYFVCIICCCSIIHMYIYTLPGTYFYICRMLYYKVLRIQVHMVKGNWFIFYICYLLFVLFFKKSWRLHEEAIVTKCKRAFEFAAISLIIQTRKLMAAFGANARPLKQKQAIEAKPKPKVGVQE